MIRGVVLCAFMEIGMAEEKDFAHFFESGVVPGWFINVRCGKVQYLIS